MSPRRPTQVHHHRISRTVISNQSMVIKEIKFSNLLSHSTFCPSIRSSYDTSTSSAADLTPSPLSYSLAAPGHAYTQGQQWEREWVLIQLKRFTIMISVREYFAVRKTHWFNGVLGILFWDFPLSLFATPTLELASHFLRVCLSKRKLCALHLRSASSSPSPSSVFRQRIRKKSSISIIISFCSTFFLLHFDSSSVRTLPV